MASPSGPFLLFASMVEAAIYGNPSVIPKFLESQKEKSRELMSFVTSNEGPTVVFCEDRKAAQERAAANKAALEKAAAENQESNFRAQGGH